MDLVVVATLVLVVRLPRRFSPVVWFLLPCWVPGSGHGAVAFFLVVDGGVPVSPPPVVVLVRTVWVQELTSSTSEGGIVSSAPESVRSSSGTVCCA